MAIPTPVNGQITDAVTQAHTKGGDTALTTIVELLETIASSLNASQAGTSSLQSSNAETLSAAFAKAEGELQDILRKV